MHGMEFQKLSSPTMIRSTYSSQTFSAFADAHGFTHRTSSPRYPQSNGVSERAVKTIKGLLKKSEDQYETLLEYWSTPLSNGYSPAELLMGGSFERPFRLYHHRWIHSDSGHISKIKGRHSVKISSVKRNRLINVTEWST